jgi:hypothetical protein
MGPASTQPNVAIHHSNSRAPLPQSLDDGLQAGSAASGALPAREAIDEDVRDWAIAQ